MMAWYDDDGCWEAVAPFFFNRATSEAAVDEVEALVRLLDLSPGARILDVGCGAGRHALELARRGFHVTGVDRTKSYLEKARESASSLDLDAEFVEADMRSFSLPSEFDAAISMSSSWGWFADEEDNLTVLRNVFSSLRPGGRLLLHTIGKEYLAARFQERTWQELDDGSLLLQERQVRDDWGWLDGRWLVVRQGEVKEYSISHPVYSGPEVDALLRRAGFGVVSVYGDLDGRPYGVDATRLVAVATRDPGQT